MMVIVDTRALIALAETRDQYHEAAVDALKLLLLEGSTLIVPHSIITEFYDNLVSEYGKRRAVEKAEKLEKSRIINIIYETVVELNLARELFLMYDDVDVSLTDCIVFAIMERRGLKRAFTFDSHFQMRGLEIVP